MTADLRATTAYSIVIDRFFDADPDNNEGKCVACTDPERVDPFRFWGGDLQGIIEKLDYVASLGIGVIRLSPIFEQVHELLDVRGHQQAGFLGQWAIDMHRIDPHLLPRAQWDLPFSSRETVFDELLQACHQRGIKVVIGIICDHIHPGGSSTPAAEVFDDGQWLLNQEADVRGWFKRSTRPSFASDGVSVNEESADYRSFLRHMLLDWMERGVDGFSFDGVHRLPIWFWQEVTSALRDAFPDVILCGMADAPVRWEDAAVEVANQAGLRLVDVAFRRHLVEALAWHDVGGLRRLARYFEQDDLFEDATVLTTYVDRNDVARLLSQGVSESHIKLAMVLLMTARGIPCVLYGSEQGLHDDREGGQHPFNLPMMTSFEPNGEIPAALSVLADLRRDNLAVQRGSYRTVWESDDVLAYIRSHKYDHVLVILNRGPDTTIDISTLPFSNGPLIDVLGSVGVIVQDGTIRGLRVLSGGAMVFAHTEVRESVGTQVVFSLSGYASRFGERTVLIGDAPELGGWDVDKAVPLEYVNRNLWIGDVSFTVSCGKRVLYKFAVIDERGHIVRESREPRVGLVPERGSAGWSSRWA